MSKNYENGLISVSEGGSDILSQDIELTGLVIWLNSATGSDSNSGLIRSQPKATLSSAIAAISSNSGSLIVVEASHSETLTSSLTISTAGANILGIGIGSAKPSFILNGNVDMFNITGDRVMINNLKFPVSSSANTSRINIVGVGVTIENCDFSCGANDLNTVTITGTATGLKVKGCTFTATTDGPDNAILIESASALGLKIENCTFDGGGFSWDDAAVYSAFAHTEFFYFKNVLINSSHIIHTAAAKGLCVGTIAGDNSRVEI